MKERYKNLLEKVYELEGLILLATSKDEMPEGLEELIERRLEELSLSPAPDNPTESASDVVGSLGEESGEASDTTPFYTLEDDDDEETSTPKTAPSLKKELPKFGAKKKLPSFSLNDRFQFLRELFGGDASKFNTALNRVASSGSFDEAERFLREDYGVNPDKSDTDERFLEAVRQYFA